MMNMVMTMNQDIIGVPFGKPSRSGARKYAIVDRDTGNVLADNGGKGYENVRKAMLDFRRLMEDRKHVFMAGSAS